MIAPSGVFGKVNRAQRGRDGCTHRHRSAPEKSKYAGKRSPSETYLLVFSKERLDEAPDIRRNAGRRRLAARARPELGE
jgi:hypothetical protein